MAQPDDDDRWHEEFVNRLLDALVADDWFDTREEAAATVREIFASVWPVPADVSGSELIEMVLLKLSRPTLH
jgi:hypothetical protein